MSYNGWSNYETWAYKLWMDNDEGSYRYWKDRAEEVYRDAGATRETPYVCSLSRKDNAVSALARELKDEADSNNPLTDASVWTDLLGAAISEIDFYEIAEALITDTDTAAIDAEDAEEVEGE